MSSLSQLSDADLLAAYKATDPFEQALKAEGVNGKAADFVRSIYQQESSGGKNTKTSNAGAVGGMQIIPSTFASVADKGWDINDPVHNTRAGIRYALQGLDAAGGDPALAGAYYYGGPGGLAKARQGVAVSDPRNPNAPTTLQYGQQVAARLPKDKGLVQRAVEAVIPSAQAEIMPANSLQGMSDADLLAAYQKLQGAPEPAQPDYGNIPRVEVRGTSADEPAPAGPSVADRIGGGIKDLTGGMVRGAGSIGATIMAPIDAAARAVGVDPNSAVGSIVGRTDRRQAMDQAMQGQGVDTNSLLYGAGKLISEVAGTSGVGGVLAKGAAAVPGISALGPAIQSGGFNVGNAITNPLLRLGARAAGGAVSGGASAGLVNPEDAWKGAAIGGVVAPLAVGAAQAGKSVSGAIRAVRDTFTAEGQKRIAADVLRLSATDPKAAAAALAGAKEIVPGSAPTMGQAAGDPGLAQLERTLLNNPQTAQALQARYAAQRAARGAAVDEVAATGPGSGSYYDDIVAGRQLFAKEDYDAALKAGVNPEMAASMQREISDLMSRPSIQAAATDAKRLAAETGENVSDAGSLQGLMWVKKALDNQISKARNPGSAIGSEDLRALTQTSQDLNSVLEQLSPKYLEANRNYAQMSRQVNSMDVARDLERRYTPASAEFGNGAQENGAAYMKALRAAQDSVKKATGRDMALGDAMSTADIYKLENVARDLARKQYAQEAGRAVGSPTAQNIISQNFLQQVVGGKTLPQSTLLNTLLRPVQFAGRLAEPQINNRLAELAVDPKAAAQVLSLPPAQLAQALNSLLLQNTMRVLPLLPAQ